MNEVTYDKLPMQRWARDGEGTFWYKAGPRFIVHLNGTVLQVFDGPGKTLRSMLLTMLPKDYPLGLDTCA